MALRLLLQIAAALLAGATPADAVEAPAVDPEELLRRVVRSQRAADERFSASTFDQREVQTTYAKDGRPKETTERLFYVLSGENGEEGTRELVTVNGRPATREEKRKVAEEDAKGRKRRLEQRAAAKAASPPAVKGSEDDPLIGSRRLSDLMGRFEFDVVGEEVFEGRPAWILEFSPRPNAPAANLGERALQSLAGRAVIDAADFQVRSIAASLVKPFKVAGGLAANVKEGALVYEGQWLSRERWFPCVVELRMKGKAGLFFRLDAEYRFEFSSFRRFEVETESEVVPASPPPSP